MEFRFRSQYYNVVDDLLSEQGFEFALDFDEPTITYKVTFERDTRIRELYQWASAAFACGLIESPRIERM